MSDGMQALKQTFDEMRRPAATSLSELAAAADRDAVAHMSLAAVWEGLLGGRTRVVEGFFTQTRSLLVLTSKPDTAAPQLDARRRHIMEASLTGQAYKSIAMDLGIGLSTVAVDARAGLKWLGLLTRPSRVHPMLILAACAAARRPVRRHASCAYLKLGTVEVLVLGVPRPESRLGAMLPEAVMQAVRGLFEGRSYAELATARGTSVRTVANQISAVFRQLRVSGRSELVQYLLERDGAIEGTCTDPSTEATLMQASRPRRSGAESLVSPYGICAG